VVFGVDREVQTMAGCLQPCAPLGPSVRSVVTHVSRKERHMKRLCVLIAATAMSVSCGGATAPPTTASAPDIRTPRPHSTLAQLMRGIPFTFSNIVFDAQSQDPGAPRAAADVGAGATATFKNVYGGWQEVENSALALAEASNLIMIPGRMCENGKPVPMQEARFQKAAQELADAGQAAYEAAKTKNQDKIVEVSETVSKACASCHEPYRDFDNPKDRCTPLEGKRAE
jgi:hypothetical protein